MAIVVNAAGGNYSAGGTWVGGVAPTSADDVDISLLTGTLTINTTCAGKTLVCGSTVGTLAIGTQTLNISGSVTLSSLMTITGTTGTLGLISTATLTSNGTTIPCNLRFNGTFTYTIADNITCGSMTGQGVTGSPTLNGNTIYCGGSLSTNGNTSLLGTTTIDITNTSTLTAANAPTSAFRLPITLSSGANTITFGTAFGLALGGSLTVNTSTSFVTTGSTLYLSGAGTITASAITFNNITISNTTSFTLGDTLNYSTNGTLTMPNSAFTFNGAFGINGGTITNIPITTNRTYTFVASQTYTFNNIILSGLSSSVLMTLVSSIASTKTNIILASGIGTQKILLVKATDIDSSGGEPIRSVGTRPQDFTRTSNWTNNSGQFFIFMK